MTDEPKHPLSWRQRSTPKRGTRRSKNWQRLTIGHHFPGTTWVLIEGPWRKIKRTGSVSWVHVLCSEEFGGCGREYDRKLDNLIQKQSTGCTHCHQQRRRRQELKASG